MTKKTTPATYEVTISPKYLVDNYNSGSQQALINAGGTITIGVMSEDSTAFLMDISEKPSKQIKKIDGGYSVTWQLDSSKLSDLENMTVQFTFTEETMKGNVSWNVFSLDYQPLHGTPITGKYLPIVYIKTHGGFFQNNVANSIYDDFLLGGTNYTEESTFPGNTIMGPSGAALSAAIKEIQVFDTIQLQPVYLVEPSPVKSPKNFMFRGDRPLGMYMKGTMPAQFDPSWNVSNSKFQKVANNQFIDFASLYDFMNNRLKLQLSSTDTLPAKINLLDVSITDLNQRYTDIPSTDLPYQELRSFSNTYNPITSASDYKTTLDSANLNTTLPVTASIGSVPLKSGSSVSFADTSKFAWVDLGTTKKPGYTKGQKHASDYAADLDSMYNLDAEKFYNFINEVIAWKNQPVDADTANVVYMHCNAGTMRTGTFLTCLLLTQHPTISVERAANYGKSLFGNNAGTARVIAHINDYWPLVQNYCSYLDLKTNNPNKRDAGIAEPTINVFNSKTAYEQHPNPWEWQQKNS